MKFDYHQIQHDHDAGPHGATTAESRAHMAIDHLREWIPSQGPIGVFVHHNTLHHFEHLPFEEAVEKVGKEVGAEPYLKHTEYLEAWRQGRIEKTAIDQAIAHTSRVMPDAAHLETMAPFTSERFVLAALQIPWQWHNKASLRWQVFFAEKYPSSPLTESSPSTIRQRSAFWRECLPSLNARLEGLLKDPPKWLKTKNSRSIPAVLENKNHQERVNKLTISFVAAYLDQGIAHFNMPRDKAAGLWAAVRPYFDPEARAGKSEISWTKDLTALWGKTGGSNTVQIVADLLEALGIPEGMWSDFIVHDHLGTSGWAGLCSMLEQNAGLYPGEIRQIALADLVALRLALHVALRPQSNDTEDQTPSDAPVTSRDTWISTSGYQILAVSEALGLSATDLLTMGDTALVTLTNHLWDFGDVPRRRLLHQAYERTFQNRILRSLHSQSHRETRPQSKGNLPARPFFQAAFCIDEREESLRRHLEELCPEVETFGAAGFFGVAFAYQDATEPRPVPLCPVLVTPKHLVTVEHSTEAVKAPANSLGRTAAALPRYLHIHGRRLWLEQLVHLTAGALGALELLVRTAAPGLSRKMAAWRDRHAGLGEIKLQFTRVETSDTPTSSMLGDLLMGFKPEEMADRVAGLLKTIGLTQNFSRLVFLVGHGSTTNNNPFASAYECGACGGRRGDRNGRLFALMANRPDVRALVAQRGVTIPDDTVFVGGCHDTCSDLIDLFETEMVPTSHQSDLKQARCYLDAALAANAHERCRRFDNARHLDVDTAHEHVIQRSFNMREPRPEYGHGSNASCVIGHRHLTRGLFLDRRSFLVSYDWRQDDSGKILEAILGAVMPVVSGISLEYYFSRIDNRRYGAGTKLPHNVVGMMGVMDGLVSDLRTGLPWQTVEIHEPMRLMTVIEAPLERIRQALSQLPMVANLLNNRWIVLSYCDPVTQQSGWIKTDGVEIFQEKNTVIPTVPNSKAYYEGLSEHLTPATILSRSHGRTA